MGINLKDELHDVISGKSQVRYGRIIQTIASYLDQGARTGPKTELSKQYKAEETEKLGLFIEDLNDENILTKNNILYFIDTVFYLTKDFN